MANDQKPVASNSERGLELHVDPDNPTGPMLKQCPKPKEASRKPPRGPQLKRSKKKS